MFASRAVQIVLFLLLLEFYMPRPHPLGLSATSCVQLVLYPWLIVTVAANPRNVIRLRNRLFEFLGTISYGIYMLHMIAVYATSAALPDGPAGSLLAGAHRPLLRSPTTRLAFGLTVLLARLSYRWFEQPFLRLKDRRFAPPSQRVSPP